MITFIIAKFFWLLLLPMVILAGVILWASETREQKICRWRKDGWTQRAIAERLDISVYKVRKALTPA